MTAAHCVVGASPDGVDVHVGTSTLRDRTAGNRATVVEVVVHPDWDESAYRNDVALLRLAEPLVFGSSVAPIRVPVSQDPNAWPSVGTAATISGWGSTEFEGDPSNQLRAAQIQILGRPDQGECGSYGSSFDRVVEICAGVPAGGIVACQGDSGSPLVVDVEGNLWVAEYRNWGDDPRRWHVFDPDGALFGVVEMPTSFTVYQIGSDFILGSWRDESDVEHVRLFELIKE